MHFICKKVLRWCTEMCSRMVTVGLLSKSNGAVNEHKVVVIAIYWLQYPNSYFYAPKKRIGVEKCMSAHKSHVILVVCFPVNASNGPSSASCSFASISHSYFAIDAITIGQLLFNLFFWIDPSKALLRRVVLGFFMPCVFILIMHLK